MQRKQTHLVQMFNVHVKVMGVCKALNWQRCEDNLCVSLTECKLYSTLEKNDMQYWLVALRTCPYSGLCDSIENCNINFPFFS